MSTELYSTRFQTPLDDRAVDEIASDIEMINIAAAQLFLVINEFKEDPFCTEDTLYALTRSGMALMAEAQPMLAELQRRRVIAKASKDAAPGGIAAASQPRAGSLRAAIDAITDPDNPHGIHQSRRAEAG